MARQWKGWALAETALFINQPVGSEHVGLYMQYANEAHQVGVFLDADAAEEVQGWLETALSAVGLANLELTKMVNSG